MKRILYSVLGVLLSASVVIAASWKTTDTEDTSIAGTEIVMLENGAGDGNNWASLTTIKTYTNYNAYSGTLLTGVTNSSAAIQAIATSLDNATEITAGTGISINSGVISITGIPSGASPTVDAAGEIAVDTTSDQLIYFGGAKRVVTHKKQIDFAIKTPVDADDFFLFKAQTAITITDIYVITIGGTSIAVDIQECTSSGTSCTTVDDAITADTDGAEDDGTLSNGSIDAGDWIKVVLAAPSGTVNYLTGSLYYVETAD
jgi:hypothetical protein